MFQGSGFPAPPQAGSPAHSSSPVPVSLERSNPEGFRCVSHGSALSRGLSIPKQLQARRSSYVAPLKSSSPASTCTSMALQAT